MDSKTRLRLETGILLAVLLAFILSASSLFAIKYTSNPDARVNMGNFNAGSLYDFYIEGVPNIAGRQYYGNESADITIAAFIEINSQSGKHFMSTIFPQLKNDYLDTGKARFYHKYHITSDDFASKNDNFLYAAYLDCMESFKKDEYYPFYFELFATEAENIPKLLERHNISSAKSTGCIKDEKFAKVKEDMSEVENFGMVGINPRFYIGISGRSNTVVDGVPEYDKFRKTIREMELLKGD